MSRFPKHTNHSSKVLSVHFTFAEGNVRTGSDQCAFGKISPAFAFSKLWPITLSPVCQAQCAVNKRLTNNLLCQSILKDKHKRGQIMNKIWVDISFQPKKEKVMVAESDVNIWPPRSSELQRCEPEMRALTPPAICFRHLHFPHLSYHPIYFQWPRQSKGNPISNIDILSFLKQKQYCGKIVHILGSFQRLMLTCQTVPPPLLCVDWLLDISCDKHSLLGGSCTPSPQLCIDGALELSGSLLPGEGILRLYMGRRANDNNCDAWPLHVRQHQIFNPCPNTSSIFSPSYKWQQLHCCVWMWQNF